MLAGHVAGVIALLGSAGVASANSIQLDFFKITNNSALYNVASQFDVTLNSVAGQPNQVMFEFRNDVGIASSITRIYFYDGVLLNMVLPHVSSAGVDFESPTNPGHLPGFNGDALSVFGAAGSGPPTSHNGIDAAGEWLRITWNLQPGKTWQDVVDGFGNGQIIIGMHIQALPDGESDSYLTLIPLPSAGFLGLAGLGLVGGIRRRRTV